MNLFPVTVRDGEIDFGAAGRLPVPADGAPREGGLTLGVRAEKITVRPDDAAEGLEGHVTMVENLGAESVVAVKLGRAGESAEVGAAARDLHYARVAGEVTVTPGQPCRVVFDLAGASWFDPADGSRLEHAPALPDVA
ncbi:MAG: TOBE domain-containing protein [Actinomadura sp.]